MPPKFRPEFREISFEIDFRKAAQISKRISRNLCLAREGKTVNHGFGTAQEEALTQAKVVTADFLSSGAHTYIGSLASAHSCDYRA